MRICDLIKCQETYQAELGHTVLETVQAMVERNYRRFGLAISLIAIGLVLVGLRLYIKQIES